MALDIEWLSGDPEVEQGLIASFAEDRDAATLHNFPRTRPNRPTGVSSGYSRYSGRRTFASRLLTQEYTLETAQLLLEHVGLDRIAPYRDKLCGDESVDELHTLHPLVTQARWLFGPEFHSSEYASNVSLRTAAEKVFKKTGVRGGFR